MSTEATGGKSKIEHTENVPQDSDLLIRIQNTIKSTLFGDKNQDSDRNSFLNHEIVSKMRSSIKSATDDGTPLRNYIKVARERLNEAVADSVSHKHEFLQRMDEISSTAIAHTSMTMEKVGLDPEEMSSFKDLCLKHPKLVICTATSIMMIPSLLFGKRVAFRNGFVIASLSSAGTYALAHWERKKDF